jgi:hypothetical protein
MDYKNINLKSGYELGQNIIEPLTSKALLLEIHCNIREINEQTILEQFETDLQSRITCAREIMKANIKNFVKGANEYRNEL